MATDKLQTATNRPTRGWGSLPSAYDGASVPHEHRDAGSSLLLEARVVAHAHYLAPLEGWDGRASKESKMRKEG